MDDAAAIAAVHVETWRTAYAGILPPEVIDARSYEQREQQARSTIGRLGPERVCVPR